MDVKTIVWFFVILLAVMLVPVYVAIKIADKDMWNDRPNTWAEKLYMILSWYFKGGWPYCYARTLRNNGKKAEAIDAYKAALNGDTTNPLSYFELSALLKEAGNVEESKRYLLLAKKQVPADQFTESERTMLSKLFPDA